MTVLKSNTLKFGERFFHQLKGTAMGTAMAVNFANLFMAKFETEILADYKKKFKKLKNYLLSGSDILMISFSRGIMMKQVKSILLILATIILQTRA